MKRILTLFWCVMLSTMIFAQAPNMMDFQSLVRDASGNFVSNQTIGVQISILKTSATGTVVYRETHSVTTNANGLLTLTIGTGTVQTGTFASIDWSAGPYFLKTEMDVNGGTSYTLTQTTQMMTVPYALYANKAGNVPDVSALEARIAALETKPAIGGNVGTVTKSSDGAIQAAFSVSATQKVYFSKGNLQYQASTKTWRFANNQYNIIGDDNKNISSTYTGWIDLFGWGTGSNPTKTSTNSSDYATFTDWGKNAISNGGNKANVWRTLSKAEWDYLFKTRPNAANLTYLATVGGVEGRIILPDDFVSKAKTSYIFKDYVYRGRYTVDNIISTQEWELYESFGACFLPNHSYARSGTNLESRKGYWSSTNYNTVSAYYGSSGVGGGTTDLCPKYYGMSVRLVKNVQ